MKTGILGGTFNPVHCAHIEVAKAALKQYGLTEVLFMTSGMPPHKKGSEIASSRHRHEMVKLALSDIPGLVPFDYEVNKTTYSYTVETLLSLREEYPEKEIYFIIGEDSLRDIIKWYKPEIILKNCIMLVYPRGESSELDSIIELRRKEFGADIRKINADTVNVSSTEIRRRVSEGKSIEGMVPDAVLRYITENGLYK